MEITISNLNQIIAVAVFVRVTQQTEMELNLMQFHFTVLFQLHFPVIPLYLTSGMQY